MSFVAELQIGSAICAFIAAFFWFRSAMTDAPPMTYEGSERLKLWLDKAARNNRWAAGFAGISALLAGIATGVTDQPSLPSAPGAGTVIPPLSLVVAALAVFFGPLVTWSVARQQIAVTARETWIREFREQVAAFTTHDITQRVYTSGDSAEERRHVEARIAVSLSSSLIRLLLIEKGLAEDATLNQAMNTILHSSTSDDVNTARTAFFSEARAILQRERAAIATDPGVWRVLGATLGVIRPLPPT